MKRHAVGFPPEIGTNPHSVPGVTAPPLPAQTIIKVTVPTSAQRDIPCQGHRRTRRKRASQHSEEVEFRFCLRIMSVVSVHYDYVCYICSCFERWGRCFTNFHYYYLGMISHLNCLNHSVWFYQGSCGWDWVVCEYVWLMIVVCVCRLGEEYGCGCPGKLARGICFLLW